jgi:hypothetical protein
LILLVLEFLERVDWTLYSIKRLRKELQGKNNRIAGIGGSLKNWAVALMYESMICGVFYYVLYIHRTIQPLYSFELFTLFDYYTRIDGSLL